MTDLLDPPRRPERESPGNAVPRDIPPEGAMRVPVRLFVAPGLEPPEEAIERLREIASLPFLRLPVAAMPDVHPKSRNRAPTGIVLATDDDLVPLAIDKGLNCGMRTVLTDVAARDLDGAALDLLFAEIRARIPIRPRREPVLGREDVLRALATGAGFASERLGAPSEEIGRIEAGGDLVADSGIDPEEAVRAVPGAAVEKGRRAIGCLGGGNHFLELQEVAAVLDRARAAALGLEVGRAVFMLHTGSEAVGSLTMSTYASHGRARDLRGRAKLFLGKLAFHAARGRLGALGRSLLGRRFWSVRASSPDGRRLAGAIAAASNFGFVNRMAVTAALREAARAALGRAAGPMPLLFDCSHVGIRREEHGGALLWIHRHGASVALPPSRCGGHPTFRSTGQPVPVPGSMGDDSFLCAGADGNLAAYGSLNHGAGRLLDKAEAIARWSEADVLREMAARRVRLYRGSRAGGGGGAMNIAEQFPRSFKSIAAVIDAMRGLGLATPIARLRPIAVMKG